jgi:hypothetical protein
MTVPATAPDPGTAAEPTPIGALSQLIQEALDKGGSYGKLAEGAIDPQTGETVSKAYLQRIVKNPPANPPNPAQMGAIAAALGKPLRHIKEATAKQWLLYEATELAGYDAEVRIIIGHLAGKSPAELKRWRMMIEADERARREAE